MSCTMYIVQYSVHTVLCHTKLHCPQGLNPASSVGK